MSYLHFYQGEIISGEKMNIFIISFKMSYEGKKAHTLAYLC